jgi:hypothetical protein
MARNSKKPGAVEHSFASGKTGETHPSFQPVAAVCAQGRQGEPASNEYLLDILASAINALRKTASSTILEIGFRLIEAKALVEHGDWLPWLERNFQWTDRTAQRYISVYGLASKYDTVSDLELPLKALYQLAAPSTPAAAIEEVITRAESGEKLSGGAVVEIVQKTIAQKTADKYVKAQKAAAKMVPASSVSGIPSPAEFFPVAKGCGMPSSKGLASPVSRIAHAPSGAIRSSKGLAFKQEKDDEADTMEYQKKIGFVIESLDILLEDGRSIGEALFDEMMVFGVRPSSPVARFIMTLKLQWTTTELSASPAQQVSKVLTELIEQYSGEPGIVAALELARVTIEGGVLLP